MNHYAFVSLDRSQNHPCNVYLERFINWSDINHNSIQRLRNKPDVSPKFFYHNILLFCALKLNRIYICFRSELPRPSNTSNDNRYRPWASRFVHPFRHSHVRITHFITFSPFNKKDKVLDIAHQKI